MSATAPTNGLQDVGPFAGYARDERPLDAYGALTAACGAALAGALLGLKATGRGLPERPRVGDIVLAGVATTRWRASPSASAARCVSPSTTCRGSSTAARRARAAQRRARRGRLPARLVLARGVPRRRRAS